MDYLIRHDDGEELRAAVRCCDKARESAERASNREALEAMPDRGVATALASAGAADSPAARGAVTISMWFDATDSGNVRSRVGYNHRIAASAS